MHDNLLKLAIVKSLALDIWKILWFQFVFKKYLSRKQWLSLLILTVGCVIQKMDIPNFRSHFQIANPKEGIEDTTKDNTNIQSKTKTLDATYISLSTGLFFIFVQVRNSTSNTLDITWHYFSLNWYESWNWLQLLSFNLDMLFSICWSLQRIHYQTHCGR